MLRTNQHHRSRPGAISIWMIISLPVAMLIAGVALYAAAINTIAIQSNSTADSAALAACRTLVSDELLQARLYGTIDGINDPPTPTLLDRARANAIRLGELNFINGRKITLDGNLPNHPDGEIVFGHVDRFVYGEPFQATVLPAIGSQYIEEIRNINAVEAVVRKQNADSIPVWGPIKQNVVVGATAILDQDVVGFKPLFDTQNIPVAPIGISQAVWNAQVAAGGPTLPTVFVEVVKQNALINLPLNAAILDIGSAAYANFAGQLANGITPAQLTLFGGEYSLDPTTNVRITPGLARYGNISGGTNFPPAALAALANLQATQKKVVFPVYSTVTPPLFGVPSPANPNTVNVTNFVAGTVQSVTFVPDFTLPTPPFPPGTILFSQRVIIGIRPTMLESPTTLTDHTRRAAINGPDNNPYIAKVRLVK